MRQSLIFLIRLILSSNSKYLKRIGTTDRNQALDAVNNLRDHLRFVIYQLGQTVVDIAATPGPAPLPGHDSPPTQYPDTPDDGLYDDLTGNHQLTITDVQLFFSHLNDEVVEESAEFYDFAGLDNGSVSVFDVQALFNRFTSS